MLVPLPVFASGWTQNQTKVNQVANIARSMGLPEDNPIIAEASRIWWADEEAKAAAKEAELMAFLGDHYADAVAMAGVMYAESRGLDKREQSMVAWCILNRLDSGRFGSTLSSVIWAKSQFAHSTRTVSDNGTDLIWLAQDVLTRYWKEKNGETNVGRTLPQGYLFYYGNGRHNLFRVSNSGKGSYNFGLEDPYE
jgi:Cell wall hydrolyses involved in spore germination